MRGSITKDSTIPYSILILFDVLEREKEEDEDEEVEDEEDEDE